MAKKRTLAPFYTKRMQRLDTAAQRTGDIRLIFEAGNTIRFVRRTRALNHLMRHSYPRPRTGVNYAAIDGRLGTLAILA